MATMSFALLLVLAVPTGPSTGGFIYDQQGSDRADVFNLRTLWFSVQGKRWASTKKSSEFAAAFRWCSNETVYCISGPLNVVVPKVMAEGSWEQSGIRCSIRRVSVRHFTGHCASPGVETSYVFETGRGIISYRVSPGSREFQLRGKRGLFSGDN
jgi:hypothetical protein